MKIDLEILRKYQADKLIDIKEHETADLLICNYTVRTQYGKFWDAVTTRCRGLVLDKEGNVIARPFPKFFNLGELPEKMIPDGPFNVYQKYDGSLGILYWIEDTPYLATRGSFISDQAKKGTELLRTYDTSKLDRTKTYLFEIIYPENRIVVDYKGEEKLVLLAIIDTETGEEMPLESDVFETATLFDGLDLEAIKNMPENMTDEGFVLKWPDGTRIKYKFDEYTRLHRLLTAITARDIWQMMKAGTSLTPLLERVPDEFYNWVKIKTKHFQSEFQRIKLFVKEKVIQARKEATIGNPCLETVELDEKDISIINNLYKGKLREFFIEEPKYEHICWAEYNKNKELVNEQIWDLLYPKHETPFTKEI